MFLYQTKINDKDGLVAASQTQDAGRQVPVYNEDVLAVLEDDGVLKEDTVAIKEDGDAVKVSISLDKTSVKMSMWDEDIVEIAATTVPDDGSPVTWSSSDESVVFVDDMGGGSAILMKEGAGTCTITASITYEGITKTATCEATVVDDLTITLDHTEATVSLQDHQGQLDLRATVTPDTSLIDQCTVEWTSSDYEIADPQEIDARWAAVLVYGLGTCTITASITVGETTRTATCVVTVTE